MPRLLSLTLGFDMASLTLKSTALLVLAAGIGPSAMLQAAPPESSSAAAEPRSSQTPPVSVALRQPAAIDPVTEQLFRTYVAFAGKIPTASVNAAIELVAERGSGNTTFRETVLGEFEKSFDDEQSSTVRRNLLKLMRKMLAKEGAWRWQHEESQRTGAINQSAAPALTDPKLLYERSKMLERVMARGRQATRGDIDAFVLAVRAAHHPQGKPFLIDVLRNPEPTNPYVAPGAAVAQGKWPDNVGGTWPDAKFHSAVALAELGEAEGVAWLIDKAKPNEFGLDGSVFGAPHAQVTSGSLRENCRYVLADLSGIQPETEFDSIIAWWEANEHKFAPKPVALRLN